MNARGKAEQQARRKARLAAALRENLKRRKAQARDRARNDGTEDIAAADGNSQSPDFRRNRSSE
jgi:hypothetical protein